MAKNIEVEVRGRFNEGFGEVIGRFRKRARFIEEKERFSLIYFKGEVPEDIREVREDKMDLKVRITNGKAEIVMKYGRWDVVESRREILIPIPAEKFDDAVELLRLLGWGEGVIMVTKTFVFEHKGLEFALVESGEVHYFEAEKVIRDSTKVKDVQKEIVSVCKEMGLEVFSEDEFIEILNELNSLRGARFDFEREPWEEVKKDFSNFFKAA